jgi:hypothetical protein
MYLSRKLSENRKLPEKPEITGKNGNYRKKRKLDEIVLLSFSGSILKKFWDFVVSAQNATICEEKK